MNLPSNGDDYSIKASLEEWLGEARSMVGYAREHYGPDQVSEILAEIDFYERLISAWDTGEAPTDRGLQPSGAIVTATLSALDHRIERATESVEALREQGPSKRLRSAQEDEERLRELRRYAATFV